MSHVARTTTIKLFDTKCRNLHEWIYAIIHQFIRAENWLTFAVTKFTEPIRTFMVCGRMCATCVPLALLRFMMRKQSIRESFLFYFSFVVKYLFYYSTHRGHSPNSALGICSALLTTHAMISHSNRKVCVRRWSNVRSKLLAQSLARTQYVEYKYNSKTVILNFARLQSYNS